MNNKWLFLAISYSSIEHSLKEISIHLMEDDPIGNTENRAAYPSDFIVLSSDDLSEGSDDLQGVQKSIDVYEASTVEFEMGKEISKEITKQVKKESLDSLEGSLGEVVIMTSMPIRLRDQNDRKKASTENLPDSDVIFIDVPSPKPIVIEDDPNTQELFNSIMCPNSSPPSTCLPEIPFAGENASPISSQWLPQEDYQRFASQTVLPS